MRLDYAWAKTGHPNCRRPDKVIDARHLALELIQLTLVVVTLSIVVHGISVKPMMRRFWRQRG